MKRISILGALALIVVVATTGCNVFEFAKPTSSAVDYIAEGQQHLWDNECSDAVISFTKAVEADSTNADARWGLAKALLCAADLTPITLLRGISTLNLDLAPGQQSLLPFSGSDWPPDRADALYQAMLGVERQLREVYSGRAFSADLKPADVALDYASALAVLALVSIRDNGTAGDQPTQPHVLDYHIQDGIDVDMIPYFQCESGGAVSLHFSAGAESRWHALGHDEQVKMADRVTTLLTEAVAILDAYGSGSQGIDIDALQRALDQINGPNGINGLVEE